MYMNGLWMPNLKFKSWMDSNRGAYWGGVVWWGKGRGNWMMPKGHSRRGWGHAHSTSLKYHVCSLWLKLSSWKISSNSTENSEMAENSVGTAYKLIKKSAENPFRNVCCWADFAEMYYSHEWILLRIYWESAENLESQFFFQHFCWTAVRNQKTAVSLHSRFFFLFLLVSSCKALSQGLQGACCSSVCCYSFNKSLKL